MKPSIAITAACMAVSACTGTEHVSQAPYQGWSCDQLSEEVARIGATLTAGEKNAIEREIIAKGCVYPLAAETE